MHLIGPGDELSVEQHCREFQRLPVLDESCTHQRLGLEMQEQVAEGDTVVTRAIWHAVHTGDFQGVPPTGKQIAIRAVLFLRFEDSKIAEYRGLFDQMGMMQQLGLIPHAEQS